MGGVFSSSSKKSNKNKKPPGGTISEVDKAVLDLKNARDRLHRYRTKLDADEKKLLVRAKSCKEEGKTTMAVNLLRLRKHKIAEAENVENQLLTVLQMVDTISSKENEKDVVTAMRTGKDALQKMHDEMSVDDVLDLMDDVKEQNEIQERIDEIIGEDVSAVKNVDVEAELAALEEELAAEAGTKEEPVQAKLPEVPTGELPKVQEAKVAEPSKQSERIAVAS